MEINLDDVIDSLQRNDDNIYFHLPSESLAYLEEEYIYFYGSNEVYDIDDLDNGEYLRLPDANDIDMYKIMKDFINQLEEGEAKDWLKEAIRGKGAFRMFRATIERFRLEDRWYKYRDQQLRLIAIDWCLKHGLEYYELNKYIEDEEEIEKEIIHEDEFRLIEIKNNNKHSIVNLVIEFRNYLSTLHDYEQNHEEISAKEEINLYLKNEYPIYAISKNGLMVAYAVLRIEDNVVWLESIFVREDYRNKGLGKILFEKGEEIAREYYNETLYNYVHPNNDLMINFLKSMGYDVLNLIEIRKAYTKEEFNKEYQIGNNIFKYKGKENE